MHIWFKDGAEKIIDDLTSQGVLQKKLNIYEHSLTGKKCIILEVEDINQADVLPFLPAIPEDIIDFVTIEETLEAERYLPQGVYRHDGAELVAKNDVSIYPSFFGKGENIVTHGQKVSIVSPTIRKAFVIYTLFRQGKLSPEENWEPK
jgi:hypothetical protein